MVLTWKKCLNFRGGGSVTSKNHGFRDPCSGIQPGRHPRWLTQWTSLSNFLVFNQWYRMSRRAPKSEKYISERYSYQILWKSLKQYFWWWGWSHDTWLEIGERAKTTTYLNMLKPKVEASVSAENISSWKDERCSITRDYPHKIFSDNLTKIYANVEKMLEFYGVGPWHQKIMIFVNSVLVYFSGRRPKWTTPNPWARSARRHPYMNITQYHIYHHPEPKMICWPKCTHTN